MSDSSDPMDCSPPGSLSMRVLEQEYWSGLPFPSPGYLPDPRIELVSPALKLDASPLSHKGSPYSSMLTT